MKQHFFCTIFIVTILLLAASCRKPSSLFEELRAEDKLEAAYHFSPSTLRMLNFQNDSSINKLVKDVRKMSFLSFKPSVMTKAGIGAFAAEFQASGEYELYLEVDGPDSQWYILGNEASEKTIALVGQKERCYAMDISGKVNFMQLPKAFQSLSDRDSTTVDGFSIFFDVIQQDAENEKRHREYRERRRLEEAKRAQEKMEADSTLLD